ncbi:MAG: monovalent cation/H(+) antiporter subunit G [Burkholderiaceae bacterium]
MTELPLWASVPAALLLILSGIVTLTGSFGLLRFKHIYTRMHAPTLGNTVGLACILLASILVSSAIGHRPIFQEILIMVFVVITSPVTAILLMRAAIARMPDYTDKR